MNKQANTQLADLRARAQAMENSLPLMQGREKGELKRLHDTTCTIREYGFMKDADGSDYVAFIVDEDTQHFYFGGMVLTNHMHEFENDGFHDSIVKEGLPVLFGEKVSKNKGEKGNKLTYTTVKFFPEA